MQVLVSGGSRTDNLVQAVSKAFSDGSVTFSSEYFLKNLTGYLNRGNFFDRAIIMQPSLSEDNSDKGDGIRSTVNMMAEVLNNHMTKQEAVFVVNREDFAEIISEETFLVQDRVKILIYSSKEKYKLSFFKAIILTPINDFDKNMVTKSMLYQPKSVETISEAEEFEATPMNDAFSGGEQTGPVELPTPENLGAQLFGSDSTDEFDEQPTGDTVSQFDRPQDIGEMMGGQTAMFEQDPVDFNAESFPDNAPYIDNNAGVQPNEQVDYNDTVQSMRNSYEQPKQEPVQQPQEQQTPEYSPTPDSFQYEPSYYPPNNQNNTGSSNNMGMQTQYSDPQPESSFDTQGTGFDSPSGFDNQSNFDNQSTGFEDQGGDFFNNDPSGNTQNYGNDLFGDPTPQQPQSTPSDNSGIFMRAAAVGAGAAMAAGMMGMTAQPQNNDSFGGGETPYTDPGAGLFEDSGASPQPDQSDMSNLFDTENNYDNPMGMNNNGMMNQGMPDMNAPMNQGMPGQMNPGMQNLMNQGMPGQMQPPQNGKAGKKAKSGGGLFGKGKKNKGGVPDPMAGAPGMMVAGAAGAAGMMAAGAAGAAGNMGAGMMNAAGNMGAGMMNNGMPDMYNQGQMGAPVGGPTNMPMMPQQPMNNSRKPTLFKSKNNQNAMVPGSGMIPQNSGPVTFTIDPNKVRDEELTTLMNSFRVRGNCMLVTGTGDSGTSTFAANLANVIASMGSTCLLVDLDIHNRTQAYINSEQFNGIHSSDPEYQGIRQSINNRTGEVAKYAYIAREGYNLLTTGLMVDFEPITDIVRDARALSNFVYGAKSNFSFVIFDVKMDDLLGPLTELIKCTDSIVLNVKPNTKSCMELMLKMYNIPDDSAMKDMFERSGIIFNMATNNKNVLGGKIRNYVDLLSMIDKTFSSIANFMPEYTFNRINILGEIPFDPKVEDFMFSRKFYSDTSEGKALYKGLLRSILMRK